MKKLVYLLLVFMLAVALCACGANSGGGKNNDKDDDGGYVSNGSTAVDTTDKKENIATKPSLSDMSIKIHYYRADGAYDEWGFWIWEQNGTAGSLYSMEETDDFGGVMVCRMSDFGTNILENGIGIIPRRLDEWIKDGEEDHIIYFNDLEMDKNFCYNLYIVEGDINVYSNEVEKNVIANSFTKLKNYIINKGTYSSTDNTYTLKLGTDYNSDGMAATRIVTYEGKDNHIRYGITYGDSVAWLTIEPYSNGVYEWSLYYSTSDWYMVGNLYASTYTDGAALSYSSTNATSSSVINAMKGLGSSMVRLICVHFNADFAAAGVTLRDLHFYSFQI